MGPDDLVPIGRRLEHFPRGWFLAAFSDQLRPGQVQKLHFMGKPAVLYRTESGQAVMTDAFCPHLGAHLGYGGTVEGEQIRCPFHGFRFDPSGACVATGYGTKPPPNAKLPVWPIEEMNGLILAYSHEDQNSPPSWRVPPLDDVGWTDLVHHTWEIDANPYDTAENSVDFGHFEAVHGYQQAEITKPLETDGPLLKASYAINRSARTFGKAKSIRAEFDIIKWGLGYSCVEVHVPEFGMHSRHFVFGRPIDEDRLCLRIAISLKHIEHPSRINPVMALLPRSWLHWIILTLSMRGYRNDVAQDFEIWQNKARILRPPVAAGDGPIPAFRVWTRQFDPGHVPEPPRLSVNAND